MAAFSFRLATLLRVREAARDELRRQLAEALKALQVLEEQQAEVSGQLTQVLGQARDHARPGEVNVDQLHQASRFALLLRAQLQVLAGQQKKVQAEVERRRQALTEGERQVRVVEKLRERQLAEYVAEEDRREGKRLDEVAVIRAARGGMR